MIEDLQTRITHLEKHIGEQDAEIYQLARRVDQLVKAVKEQKNQLTSLAESGGQSQPGSAADEKPPHY